MEKNIELQLNGVVDDVDLDTPIDFDEIEEKSKNLIITFSQLKIPSSSNSKFPSTNVCFLTSVYNQKLNADYQFSFYFCKDWNIKRGEASLLDLFLNCIS